MRNASNSIEFIIFLFDYQPYQIQTSWQVTPLLSMFLISFCLLVWSEGNGVKSCWRGLAYRQRFVCLDWYEMHLAMLRGDLNTIQSADLSLSWPRLALRRIRAKAFNGNLMIFVGLSDDLVSMNWLLGDGAHVFAAGLYPVAARITSGWLYSITFCHCAIFSDLCAANHF